MGNGSSTGNSGTTICIVLAVVALLIIGAVVCFTSEKFKNIRKKKKDRFTQQKSDLAKLDVMAIISPSCGYCKKFLKMLEDAGETSNVSIIDMSKGLNDNDHNALQQMGFTGGVPFISSRATKKNHPGCPKSLDALVQSLSTPTQGSGGPHVNQAKDLGIIFFGRPGCPYCVRMKEMLEGDGLMEVIDFVDTGSPAGAKKLPKNARGVPHFYSKKTGQSHTGAVPNSGDLLQKLSKKKTERFTQPDPIRDLQITMYKSDSCGFCKKAMNILGPHLSKIELVDGMPPGATGVPHFKSKKTNKEHTGCPQSVEHLIQALSGTESFGNALPPGIEMYYADFCGHCKRTKQMLKDAGVIDQITLIDVSTPQGQAAIKKAGGEGGIPHFRNTRNGKTHTGAPRNIQDLKQKLT